MSWIGFEGQDLKKKKKSPDLYSTRQRSEMRFCCTLWSATIVLLHNQSSRHTEKKKRPQTCSNIPGQQNNLTTNLPWHKRQSLNLSLSLCVEHTSNYSELVTLLLILLVVQGIFNQQTCKSRIIFQACVATGWSSREQISCSARPKERLWKCKNAVRQSKLFPSHCWG